MAVFQFQDFSLPYRFDFSDFSFDVILLQGSKFNSNFWQPVFAAGVFGDRGGGRVLTCDWPASMPVEVLDRLIRTLGLNRARIVAADDAVRLVESLAPEIFETSLLYPQGAPLGPELVKEIEKFLRPE